ncbi:hypothetical protein [Effusibacillus pohliae]|uniref:hypothetical protein n=1 Tax=Effusibacillus pohliae TaxID=232270 RepID=UPI0003658D51|nr:hypothetical protein [Effusibacillus pohliae]
MYGTIKRCKWLGLLFLCIVLLTGCAAEKSNAVPQFASQEQLDSHYQKHVIEQKEFGNISKQEYLKRAQTLVTSPPGDSILTKTRSNGDRLYYNKTTNEFAAVTKDGIIKTFFKPKDGIDYFNKQ